MEFNDDSILKEYSVYSVFGNKFSYTMKELNDMGFEYLDSSLFLNNNFESIKTVEYHDGLTKVHTITTLSDLMTRSFKLEVEEAILRLRIFAKIEGEKLIAIELKEFYILDFMGTPFFFNSIEERKENRTKLLNSLNKFNRKISKSIDIYPDMRKDYQKQLSTRKTHEKYEKN